jgi:hypothetical protein
LSGNRNAQGDFMPEDIQMKGVQDAVAPDIQNYIDDVKAQVDEIDAHLDEINSRDTDVDMPGVIETIQSLEAQRAKLLQDLSDNLAEEGVEVPPQLADMINEGWQRKQDQLDSDSNTQVFEGYEYPETI